MTQSHIPQKQAQGNARNREMGRDVEPLGDLGQQGKSWTPPAGAQGISNRAEDENPAGDPSAPEGDDDQGEDQGQNEEGTAYVAGGDKSNRAARSGATGERHPGGRANKPEPKNQDEKGNAGPRNNTNRS